MSLNLHVLTNPGKPKGKKKKMSKKKGKKRAKKRGVGAAVVRYVKKARGAVCKTKTHRKRRRNPGISLRKMGGGMPSGKTVIGVALGTLLIAASTKALAQGAPVFAGSGPSSAFGEPWNAKQYAAAGAIALIGPKIAEKVVRGSGTAVGLTALALIVGKTILPLAGKTGLGKYLGESANEGDIQVDESGQSWIMQGGRWMSLQGLVESSPMDGWDDDPSVMDGLVESSPMDAIDDDYGITTSALSVH